MYINLQSIKNKEAVKSKAAHFVRGFSFPVVFAQLAVT